MAERTATSVWNGNLNEGSGRVTVESGALPEFPVTWAARTVRSDGKTSPEELIAAAHSSCFSMAVSNVLAKNGNTPESLEVQSTVIFERINDKPTASTVEVRVRGRVPGIERSTFEQTVREAGLDCPISRALKGSMEIKILDIQLQS
ncbi:MAG TPA: OsmC family peroxiredoxin [Chloroflexia bacterium]|nr:OsmC family peroxiredoxin [Chloroflexia bacterium]